MFWVLKKFYNKIKIYDVPINPDSSYVLMCNHLGFLDGFWALYLSYHAISKKQKANNNYILILKKQLQKNPWLKYFGCFSIVPHSKSADESLKYAAEILSTPGNVLIIFPQGNIESQYVRHIEFKDGLSKIMPQVKGNCQLIWSTNLTEYFESLKPTLFCHMLDCGTNQHFNFDELKSNINQHHKKAIQKQIRFTIET
jgi:1-acyl-sn-glycerol-3-phosphate acyltransferase